MLFLVEFLTIFHALSATDIKEKAFKMFTNARYTAVYFK